MNRAEVDELQYTTDMINTNFSNYSAWHNRRYDLIAIMFRFSDLFLAIKIGIGFQLFSE
jgi:geranylgeranyl transferase type-2 subunit alpha